MNFLERHFHCFNIPQRVENRFVFHTQITMSETWITYRRNTRGWKSDPCAIVHPRIIFGPGNRLTPEFVEKYKITHVVNCADDDACPDWFRSGCSTNYACLNAEDNLKVLITNWYPEFQRIMDSFLQAPQSRTIYVHCQCGINRSGFLILLYVCKKFQYSYDMTVKSILSQRPCALTNPSFNTEVKRYISIK